MTKRTFCFGLMLAVVALAGCLSAGVTQGQGNLVVFRGGNLDFILPNTAPGAGQVTTQLEATATPGEIEGVGFGVQARRDVPNATVTVTNLTGPGGASIPAADIDPRVVQVWDQKGLRGKEFDTIRVAEGLLKDDSLNLLDPQYTETNLPSIPPEAAVRTDLKQGQSKGFYLVIRVPNNAVGGDYTGTVTVGGGDASVPVKLVVHVLPYKLRGPGRIIGMYYNDLLDGSTPLPVYRARLQAMRDLGVDALRLLGDRQNLPAELTEIKKAGFPGPIMVWDSKAVEAPNPGNLFAKYVRELTAAGYDPYIYGVDEPNKLKAPPGEPMSTEGEMRVMQATKQAGGLTATAIMPKTDEYLLQQGQVLDFPLYSLVATTGWPEFSARMMRMSVEAVQAQKAHPKQGYYFGSWAENPRRNRLLMGYFLYNSRMDAAFGWTFYSFHMKNSGQIFNDFDLDGNKKRWMTVFPTAEGYAPTLQSEAFREGVDDLRYLNTFLVLAKEKQDGGMNVESLRQQVLQAVARYSDFGDDKPEDTTANRYTNKQFEDTRAVIIAATLKLL